MLVVYCRAAVLPRLRSAAETVVSSDSNVMLRACACQVTMTLYNDCLNAMIPLFFDE